VRVSFDFDEHFRLALAEHYGRDRKITQKDIAQWISALVQAGEEDICADYDAGLNRAPGDEPKWPVKPRRRTFGRTEPD
jgi:hypothetical protein